MLKLQQDWFLKFSGGGGYSVTRVPSIIWRWRWSLNTFVWKDNEAFQKVATVTLRLRIKFKRKTWITWVHQGTNTLKVTALNIESINTPTDFVVLSVRWRDLCSIQMWSDLALKFEAWLFFTRNIVQSDWLNSVLRSLWRKKTSLKRF